MAEIYGNLKLRGEILMENNKIKNLGAPIDGTDAVRLQDVGPGFYGISFKESEAGGAVFVDDTLVVDSNIFYLSSDGNAKPILGFTRYIQSTSDAASSRVLSLGAGDRSSPTDNDEGYISLLNDNDAGDQSEFARISWIATDVTDSLKTSYVKIETQSFNAFDGPYLSNYGSGWVAVGGSREHEGGTEIIFPTDDTSGLGFWIGSGNPATNINPIYLAALETVITRSGANGGPVLRFEDSRSGPATNREDYTINNVSNVLTIAPVSQNAQSHFISLNTSVRLNPSYSPVANDFTHGFLEHDATWAVSTAGTTTMLRFAPTVTWSNNLRSIACVQDSATITQNASGGASSTMVTFSGNRTWNYSGAGDMPNFDTFAEYGVVSCSGTPSVGATVTSAVVHNRRAWRSVGGGTFSYPTVSTVETDMDLTATNVADTISIAEFNDIWSKPPRTSGSGTTTEVVRNVVKAVDDTIALSYNVIWADTTAGANRRFINHTGAARSDHGGVFAINADSTKLFFGAGDDCSISFDGTDLEIKLDDNGTNNLNIGDGGSTDYASVDSNGAVTFTGASGLAFAEIYGKDQAGTISLDADLADVKVTNFTTNGQSLNCTADAANDKITFTKTGKYLVTASLVTALATATPTDLIVSAYWNGTIQNNLHCQRSITAANRRASMSISGILDVTATSTDLELRANVTDTNPRTAIFHDLNLTVVQIGGT